MSCIKKISVVLCLAAASAFVLLYLDFVGDIGAYPEHETGADAIVVLAGGLGRVDKGFELFMQHKAEYFIIAGVDREASLESIFFKKAIRIDKKRMILEKGSKSTYENAQETKKIIEDLGIRSIILVTSFYHLKRASFTFQRILPSHVRLYVHPVITPNFNEKAWWRGRGGFLMAEECIKFYWYRLWL